MRLIVFCLAALSILAPALPTWAGKSAPCSQTTWDIETDWNTSFAFPNEANPVPDSCGRPVWQLLRYQPLLGYDLLDAYRHTYGGIGETPLENWEPSDPEWCDSYYLSCTPAVTKNFSVDIYPIGWNVPAQAVMLHGGPTHSAAVAWQSPIKGNVRVEGSFVHLDTSGCGNGVGWRVYRNGTLLSEGTLSSTGSEIQSAPFLYSRDAVVKGDMFVFVVDPLNDVSCDSTQLKVTVKKVK